MGIWKAHEIPGRIDKRVHGISISFCPTATLWTRGIHPLFGRFEGITSFASRPVTIELGQFHRQLLCRYRHSSTLLAMNHGNRCSPISLPADQPVSQSPALCMHSVFPSLGKHGDNPLRCLGRRNSSQITTSSGQNTMMHEHLVNGTGYSGVLLSSRGNV